MRKLTQSLERGNEEEIASMPITRRHLPDLIPLKREKNAHFNVALPR
jgi:hypothetical protein